MGTTDYRTKTMIIERFNPFRNRNVWVLAIDVGYSGTKVMSGNTIACFPSYAKKMPKNTISLATPEDSDILFKELPSGDIWAVGAKAETMNTADMTTDNDAVLYGRNRYYSDNFQIVAQAGLALGLMENAYGSPLGKKVIVQTGLPSGYLDDDKNDLRRALSGHRTFELKIGNQPWKKFDFTIDMKNIWVTQQPMGTLASITMDASGNPTPDSEKIFRSNTLVVDPGFRTGDTCYIMSGNTNSSICNTYDDMSMYEVLSRTVAELKSKYNVQLSVPSIQTHLESGVVTARDLSDRKHPKTQKIEFEDILFGQSRSVCEAAIDKLMDVYNYFTDVDFLVLTGGLSEVWMPIFEERLGGLESLTIIPGNRMEQLPQIFSNVRGYYMFRINIARN